MGRSVITSRRLTPAVEVLEDRTLLDGAGPVLPDFLQVDTQAYRGDRLLLQLRPDATLPAPKGLTPQASAALGGGWYEVLLPVDVSVADALSLFQQEAGVLAVQPDYQISLSRTPNDPGFTQLWGMNNPGGRAGWKGDADIDAAEAWDQRTSASSIIVAVIDTGVDYTHPDLAANMWRNAGEIAGNGRDDDGNGFVDDVYGYDFANNDSNPMDDNGHGTHVAGTIGAVGDNGYGVAGVAWEVRLMAVKFLGAGGSGYTSNAIRALNYAVANGAVLSNNSWGGGTFDTALNNAIANARSQGHIFVAAAGNEARNNDASPSYPASYPLDNVVAVAALTAQDQLASFSNYGRTTVDLAAPGVGIYSTLPGRRFGTMSGTSMATPHVTGALALVWAQHPGWTYRQVIDRVLATTDPLAALAGKTVTGGRLNLARALGTDSGGGGTLPGAHVIEMTVLKAGAQVTGVRLTFDQAINPATFTPADVRLQRGTVSSAVQAVYAVAGTGNTTFEVSFGLLSAPGTYTLTVGPDIRNLQNQAMDQDRDGLPGQVTDFFTSAFTVQSALVFTASTAKAINDLQTTVSPRVVGRLDVIINDLNVEVTLTHSWVGDLRLRLRAPNGQEVILFVRRGGSGDNLTGTVFDDEAPLSLTEGLAPFTGSFRPEGNLSLFNGRNAYGTWRLYVDDQSLGVTGLLQSWSLVIEPRTGISRVSAQEKEQRFLSARQAATAAEVGASAPAPSAPLAAKSPTTPQAQAAAFFQQEVPSWRLSRTEAALSLNGKRNPSPPPLLERRWW